MNNKDKNEDGIVSPYVPDMQPKSGVAKISLDLLTKEQSATFDAVIETLEETVKKHGFTGRMMIAVETNQKAWLVGGDFVSETLMEILKHQIIRINDELQGRDKKNDSNKNTGG